MIHTSEKLPAVILITPCLYGDFKWTNIKTKISKSQHFFLVKEKKMTVSLLDTVLLGIKASISLIHPDTFALVFTGV